MAIAHPLEAAFVARLQPMWCQHKPLINFRSKYGSWRSTGRFHFERRNVFRRDP
jgi:hypothetical protein